MKMRIIGLSLLLVGCSGTGQIRHAMVEVEQAAITANDLQLVVSKKGLCSSAMSSVLRAYGGKPEQLRHLFGLCGWSDYLIDIMTGEKQ